MIFYNNIERNNQRKNKGTIVGIELFGEIAIRKARNYCNGFEVYKKYMCILRKEYTIPKENSSYANII